MIPHKTKIGFEIDTIINITGNEAIELCKNGAVMVDIREEYDTVVRQFDIENLILLPYSVFKEHYMKLPADVTLIIADGVGTRSKDIVIFLKSKQFENIMNLAGGIVDWVKAGHKVNKNKNEMLHGQCACMLKSNTGRKFDFK